MLPLHAAVVIGGAAAPRIHVLLGQLRLLTREVGGAGPIYCAARSVCSHRRCRRPAPPHPPRAAPPGKETHSTASGLTAAERDMGEVARASMPSIHQPKLIH